LLTNIFPAGLGFPHMMMGMLSFTNAMRGFIEL